MSTRASRAVAATTLASGTRTVILVEGVSDQLALEALAQRRGRNLKGEGVAVVPIGGATNIGRALTLYGPGGAGLRLAGLCDTGKEGDFRRALQRAGLGVRLTRDAMERLGFFVCVADLEDELIRALGPAAVERVIDDQGELELLRSFQNQPAWRGRKRDEQLRRFFGTLGGRKIPVCGVAGRCARSRPGASTARTAPGLRLSR